MTFLDSLILEGFPVRLLPTLSISLLACFSLLAGGLATPQTASAASASCSEIDVPISVPSPREVVHGQLCMPAGNAPTTVQLLVHGGTYNRMYWDLPYQPERYSYQRDMARHGYATFAMDRLGTGQSTKPPSAVLVDSVEAASIHQVIGHLRAGRVGGARFDRVVLVGASVGSGVVTLEAATYHDVDGVILTAATHLPSALELAKGLALYVQPVTADPKFRKNGSDPGYVTTRPGGREPLFYVASNADPEVIATDETTKDQASALGLGTVAVSGIVGPTSRSINVPVFLAVGEKDVLFCGFLASDCSSADALRKQEAPFYDAAAELSTFILPESGHSIALHKNADKYRDATRAWLRAQFDV